jgi:hypothetical protein
MVISTMASQPKQGKHEKLKTLVKI